MKKIIFLVAMSLFLYGYNVHAACLSEACYNRPLQKVFPEARADMKSGKLANPKALASNLAGQSRPAYGFAAGISKEKGSFVLGVLLTDLSVTIAANHTEGIKTTTGALAEGFKYLQAPEPLIEATAKMQAAAVSGAGKKEMEMILSVVEPFIFDYVKKEGKDIYMQFGFWVENARLFLLQDNVDLAVGFLKSPMGASGASYFAEALKKDDLPQGIMSALDALSKLSAKGDIGSRDISSATRAIKTIGELMG